MGDPWNVLFAQGALGWGPVSVPPKRGWWQVLHLERLMLTHDLVSRIFTVKQGSLFVSLSNLHNITHVLRMLLPNFPCIPTENVLLVYKGLLLTLSFRAHDFVSIYFTLQYFALVWNICVSGFIIHILRQQGITFCPCKTYFVYGYFCPHGCLCNMSMQCP